MSELTVANVYTTLSPVDHTLWHCTLCDALISIQSSYALVEAFCPACVEAPLEFCGPFRTPMSYTANA
jgi:hypothetical protein